MPRSVPEWIGATPNSRIPLRVRDRVYYRCHQACAICYRQWQIWRMDHIVALANGGENRENNLQLLCVSCHTEKTREDVAVKSKAYRQRTKHVWSKPARKRKMPHGKDAPTKRKITGEVVPR